MLATGVNTALADHDPSAHAEAAAVRAACRQLKTLSLNGATLAASCEPCAICVSIALAAGVERIIYAATKDQVPDLGSSLPPIVAEISAHAHVDRRRPHRARADTGSDGTVRAVPRPPAEVKQLRLVVEAEDFDEAVAFYRDVLGLPGRVRQTRRRRAGRGTPRRPRHVGARQSGAAPADRSGRGRP